MIAPYMLEVRLTGDDMRPDRVSARDASVLIAAIETLIASILAADPTAPADPSDRDAVIVSLAGLRPDGFALLFASPHPDQLTGAFDQVIDCLQRGTLDSLPTRAVEALRGALRVTRKYGATLELSATHAGRDRVHRTAFASDLVIKDHDAAVRGTRSLYGAVIRVGGEEPPRARLRLLNGDVISCDLARRKGWMLARDLGARLYQVVGVRGEARIRISDGALTAFRIERVLPYVPIGIERALDALAAASRAAFAPGVTGAPTDLREE